MINRTATTADGKSSISLGTWEGETAWTEVPYFALCNLAVGIYLVYTPVIIVGAAETGNFEAASSVVATFFNWSARCPI